MEGRRLDELDGKTVRAQDRKYLFALASHNANKKRGNRSQSLGASAGKKRSNSY